MIPKTVDSKGRLTLGPHFANRVVLFEQVDETEVRVVLARIVPEREAGLHQNSVALSMVQRGLREASEGQTAEAPDLGEEVFEAYARNRTPGADRVFWCYGPRKRQRTIIAITPHP